MKKIFVSHPFTGNEKQNRSDAAGIVASLQYENPNMQFINPLEVFRPMEGLCADYVIMATCMNLIRGAMLYCSATAGRKALAAGQRPLLQLSTRYRALIVMIYQMKNEQQKTAPKGGY